MCISDGNFDRFLKNLAFLVFLQPPFWYLPFGLITKEMACEKMTVTVVIYIDMGTKSLSTEI